MGCGGITPRLQISKNLYKVRIKILAVLFTQGINEWQTKANLTHDGDSAEIQNLINKDGRHVLNEYARQVRDPQNRCHNPDDLAQQPGQKLDEILKELQHEVNQAAAEHQYEKNYEILLKVCMHVCLCGSRPCLTPFPRSSPPTPNPSGGRCHQAARWRPLHVVQVGKGSHVNVRDARAGAGAFIVWAAARVSDSAATREVDFGD